MTESSGNKRNKAKKNNGFKFARKQVLNDFKKIVKELLYNSAGLQDGSWRIIILINPASGLLKHGFRHRRMIKYLKRLNMVRSGISSGSPDPESLPVITIFETENPAHAAELGVKSALELSENNSHNQRGHRNNRLLLLAGGDGFHNNILSSIINKAPGTLKDFSIFRLPMGTGNDSADVKNTDEAFAVLSSPSGIKKDSIIRITTSCGKEYTALNIVSFGLDAYVCELTNNIKEIAGPEIIYKLSANIAILQYEKKWPLNEWEVQIYKKNENTVLTRKNRFQLVVFGRKGNTTYGGGLKVLPAEENFLLVEPLNVMQKIKIKPLFYRGDHRGLPVTEFFKTEKVVLNYHEPVLMETDGEVIYLKKEDFPLTISIISDYLQVIK